MRWSGSRLARLTRRSFRHRLDSRLSSQPACPGSRGPRARRSTSSRGRLVLRRVPEGLELVSEDLPRSWPAEIEVVNDDLVLALLRGRGAGGPGGLLFFSGGQNGGIRWGSKTLTPPGAAILHPYDTPRWELPGEDLFRLTRGQASGNPGIVVAGRLVLGFVGDARRRIGGATSSTTHRSRERRSRFGSHDASARAEEEVGSLMELLAAFPLSSKSERQKWKDVHRVLRALADLERVTLVSGTSPPGFQLMLYPDRDRID